MKVLRSLNRRGESGGHATQSAVLHVGAPKTGSTFLQQVLWHNREVLASAGVGYPLEEEREHFAATMDLREMTWGGSRDPAWDGAWERIATRMRDWPGHTAVFSNELLGGATHEQIFRAVRSVSPAEVEVVFTARDLARQLSSDWQEQVKHTHAVSFDDFVDDLVAHGLDATPPFGPMFWGLHDPVHVLRPWAEVVGADHVYVVTVPHAGAPRDTLWRRFADRLHVDPQQCNLDLAKANPSLGAVEAELLRAINERADGMPARNYDDALRGRLIEDVLQGRSVRAPIALPERHLDWVRKRSQELIDGLRDAGFRVVGNLSDLEPVVPVQGAVDPAHVDQAVFLDTALDTLASLITNHPDADDQA
jgi:hypothetical protein